MQRLVLLAALVFWPASAHAAADMASARLAREARSAWPAKLSSPADFNMASAGEILAFAHAFEALPTQRAALVKFTRVKNPDLASVERWRAQTRARMEANLIRARSGCTATDVFPCSGSGASIEIPPAYRTWWDASRAFHAFYLQEQLRLAALFPSTSSEAFAFNSSELTGDEDARDDLSFTLTFDDGPTSPSGQTDAIIKTLAGQGVGAWFFVLGESFSRRLKSMGDQAMRALYAGHCVGSHGFTHARHPRLRDWKGSIDKTRKIIMDVFPSQGQSVPFRPPYGQRLEAQAAHVAASGQKVYLWNIDSQDWNPRFDSAAVRDRVTTLMLLRRKGIILFHDIHPKTNHFLASWLPAMRDAGVKWSPCQGS